MRRRLAFLAAAQLADLLTTAWSSAHGGIEVNPFVRWSLSVGGIPALFTFKAQTFTVIATIAMKYQDRLSVRVAIGFGIVITAIVAANNLFLGGS